MSCSLRANLPACPLPQATSQLLTGSVSEVMKDEQVRGACCAGYCRCARHTCHLHCGGVRTWQIREYSTCGSTLRVSIYPCLVFLNDRISTKYLKSHLICSTFFSSRLMHRSTSSRRSSSRTWWATTCCRRRVATRCGSPSSTRCSRGLSGENTLSVLSQVHTSLGCGVDL